MMDSRELKEKLTMARRHPGNVGDIRAARKSWTGWKSI